MEGDLREFSIAEIVQFISLGRRTGTLEVRHRDQVRRISFTEGTITGLAADDWSIGRALRSSGLLPDDGSEPGSIEMLTANELRERCLAASLIDDGDWSAFVARQTERLLYDLFDQREGRFLFRLGDASTAVALPVAISADRAVLEGSRWADVRSRHRNDQSPTDARFERATPPPAQVLLTPPQWRVMVVLEQPGTIDQIAVRAKLSLLDTIESLVALTEAGLIRQRVST